LEVTDQIHEPDAIYRGKKIPCYPLKRRLGMSQSQCGHFGEKKRLYCAEN
jgi:hypothetical protein